MHLLTATVQGWHMDGHYIGMHWGWWIFWLLVLLVIGVLLWRLVAGDRRGGGPPGAGGPSESAE